MKELRNIFKKYKYVCFLDFEATQFDHQLIALGGVMVKVNTDGTLGKEKNGIFAYVKTKSSIGSLVRKLTGINEKMLQEQGIEFENSINKIKAYCGSDLSSTLFTTFGPNDLLILRDTYAKQKIKDMSFLYFIKSNYLDLQSFISKYIRSPKGTNYSLYNMVKLYNLEKQGTEHNPLSDAINLKNLAKAFDINQEIFITNYLNLLLRYSKAPAPIIKLLRKLNKTKDSVTYEEFISFIKEQFND